MRRAPRRGRRAGRPRPAGRQTTRRAWPRRACESPRSREAAPLGSPDDAGTAAAQPRGLGTTASLRGDPLGRAQLCAPPARTRPGRHRALLRLAVELKIDRLVEEADEVAQRRGVVTRIRIRPGEVLDELVANTD